MPLSNKWNMLDNVYVQSRMGMKTTQTNPVATVDPFITQYAENHDRKDTLLYNNRVFFGYIRPSQQVKDQYDINRTWILNHFS
jgi:hypothetical protein